MTSQASDENTDKLINSLCGELKSCTVITHPLKRVLPWIFLAFFYVLGAVYLQGFRHDLSEKLSDATFLFEPPLSV